MAKNSFDTLVDELRAEIGFSKALETTEDDQRIAAATGEDGDGGLDPADQAILSTFRKVADVVAALGKEVRELRGEVDELKTGGGKPMTKAMRGRRDARKLGEEFMAKALDAQSAGRLTGTQVAIAESHINAGKAPPKDIVESVLQGASAPVGG